MPFKSKAQQRYMFWKHPGIAKRWAEEYGVPDDLPEQKRKRRRRSVELEALRRIAEGRSGD